MLLRAAASALLFAATAGAAQAAASSPQFCDRTVATSAQQQDRLLRFADVIRRTLDASGESVALVSRTGLDLQRFGVRYSHAGVSLKHSPNTPWSVRQLYYACDEGRPRLFDQGLPGFLFGADDADLGYVSIVLLPRAAAGALEGAALDNPLALRLLAGRYSANAHPLSTRYQNCNQWVAELLAAAWGGLRDDADVRDRAQAWLARRGYQGATVPLGSPLLRLAGAFVPLVHFDDQADEDLAALRVRTSLPEGIEDFIRWRVPGARRIELCHDGAKVVVREGWAPMGAGCEARAGDEVLALD